MQDNKNIILATVLSAIILIGWTFLYEKPKAEKRAASAKALIQQDSPSASSPQAVKSSSGSIASKESIRTPAKLRTRSDVLSESKDNRIRISTQNLHGSIYLKGARFDDLTLAKYFSTSAKEEEVKLFSPSKSQERYFADFGWISTDRSLDIPKPSTLWKSNATKLTPESPVTLSWTSKQNVEFLINISIDKEYMFAVTQSVKNHSNEDVYLTPYGRINRVLNTLERSNYILHEGPIGVFSGTLTETSYKDLIEERNQSFESKNGGWFGITDKYWLSSIIPDKSLHYITNFTNSVTNHNSIYNTEFVGKEYKVAENEELNFSHHLFAGAKKVKLLDKYSEEFDITLFDRAVDFGWLYFLTKPLFFALDFFYQFLGNFGLAILAMTVIIKLALFPMANKSYTAIGKVKKLQPQIDKIKEANKGDRVALNREMMALYKEKKVNPASGCLPILVQIPIFFALYKVLFVALDMRHAPFYGWIHDLSAPDPTSIFNLFGLLPFQPSGSFVIGIWPILMGLTMFIQQKLSPMSSDPTQAKILKFMPYVLTFVLAAFPAGLVIYWTWSNTLSVLQQWIITRKLNKEV